ncbi:MAG TPA: phospholipase [Rubrivivax sp.]|mgnify:CR=1 FL=1|nr:phospholipase [Rubrivivax sp.]
MRALQIHAGATALQRLRERGLRPQDVRVIPAAAGGAKGLILNGLDRFIFGAWLAEAPSATHSVHLLGASIGAWRMASACLADPAAQLAQMADDYIHQDYEHAPGKPPAPRHVSEVLGAKLRQRFARRETEVLSHPRYRLHVFTSRGRHLLRRQGRLRMPLGYAGAFLTNTVSRKAMGGWLERVVFSDTREPLPLPLHDYRTHQVALAADNLCPGILASCSIPFWLDAVHDIPGAPPGAYWDGGITDYHLHLNYGAMQDGLVLYPHFQKTVIPGWLDKALKHRHRATAHLDNVVLLSPRPEWIATLPNAKLPDRNDFKTYGDDLKGRVAAWGRALREGQRLADEFAQLVSSGRPIAAEPLV